MQYHGFEIEKARSLFRLSNLKDRCPCKNATIRGRFFFFRAPLATTCLSSLSESVHISVPERHRGHCHIQAQGINKAGGPLSVFDTCRLIEIFKAYVSRSLDIGSWGLRSNIPSMKIWTKLSVSLSLCLSISRSLCLFLYSQSIDRLPDRNWLCVALSAS